MQTSVLKNSVNIARVLWFSLLGSHGILSFIVLGDFFQRSSMPREENFTLILLGSVLILILCYGYFRKITHSDHLKNLVRTIDPDQMLTKNKNINPELVSRLSEDEKKRYFVILNLQVKAILCWAVCEFSLIIGFIGFVLGFVPDKTHFSCFSIMSIAAMLLMYPKFAQEIIDLRL